MDCPTKATGWLRRLSRDAVFFSSAFGKLRGSVAAALRPSVFSDERLGRQTMSKLGRRLVLRGSVGLAAAGTFASPYIARPQAKTASVLWGQGFVNGEDEGFKKLVAALQKAR